MRILAAVPLDDTLPSAVALDLTPPMPSVISVLSQWSAEPVRHVFLPASAFIANAKGYPVLPKVTQGFVRDIMKVREIIFLPAYESKGH